jgi:FKBP-type peptidyl-prolyl cis-trans isomerase 2
MQRYAILLAVMLIAVACSGDDEGATTTTAATTAPSVADPTPTVSPSGDDVPKNGDSVEVHYVGTLDDGTQFDSSRDRQDPLVFEVGFNPPQVIAGFEDAVRGMAVGDVVTVRIPPEEAYGSVDEELIFSVPIEDAPEDVAVFDEVLIGGVTTGVVTAVSETEVTIDTNHPFAGQALTFEIELLSISG